jgi:hypothetical protein
MHNVLTRFVLPPVSFAARQRSERHPQKKNRSTVRSKKNMHHAEENTARNHKLSLFLWTSLRMSVRGFMRVNITTPTNTK